VRTLITLWCAGLLALVPRWQAVAGKATDVNVISKVELRGTAVEIAGSRKPNFTTFTMTDPPRLVVDISEAVFSHVPEEIPVQNGTIRVIKTAGYGSGSSAIARVIIGFERNVETDITNFGENGLLVKILGEGSPAVAESEKPAPSPRAGAERSPTASPVASASGADRAVKTVEKPKQDAPAVAPKPAPEQPKPEVARVNKQAELERLQREQEEREAKRREAEAAKRAEAEAQRAEAEAKRAAQLKAQEGERQKRLAEIEEKKRRENEERIAHVKANEERLRQAEEEKQRKQEAAKLAKELQREKAKAEDERREQAAAERRKKLEEARVANRIEAEERAKAEEERRRRAAADRQSKQEAALLARRLERERVTAEKHRYVGVKVAKASSSRSDAGEVPRIRRRPTGRGGSAVTFVGFANEPSGSRVFVRTNGPVEYSVTEGKNKTVILELENARIPLRNNTRPLDTSQFDSAVAMVEPNQAPERKVRVQIRLRDSVPYRAKQEGNEVVLDFGPPVHP
jgi:colicin import membrane protein